MEIHRNSHLHCVAFHTRRNIINNELTTTIQANAARISEFHTTSKFDQAFNNTSSKTLLSSATCTYSLVPSPCSLAVAVSAPSAASPAPAPCGGSPSSSGAPVAPADASMLGVPVAAADEGKQQT